MKFNPITLSLLLFVIAVAIPTASAFSGTGAGTAGDPYIITTPAQLDEIRNDLTAYYELGNSIDMAGYNGFEPIGDWFTAPFTGAFDGNNFTISNLHIISNDDGNYPAGFFGPTESTLWVRNFFMDNFTLESTAADGVSFNAGGLISGYDGAGPLDVSNVHYTNTLIYLPNVTEVGGLFSYNDEIVAYNLSFTGEVHGKKAVGGLASSHEFASAEFVSINATIYLHPDSLSYAGIFAAFTQGSTVKNSYAVGEIRLVPGTSCVAIECRIGGFIGTNENTGSVINESYVFANFIGIDGANLPNPFLGYDELTNAVCNNAYYNSENSTPISVDECSTTGLTDVQMSNQTNFVGFDFVNVWTLYNAVTPVFDWQSPSPPCNEDWVCDGYAGSVCLLNDTSTASCNSVFDNNSCGTSYTGNYSEFANQTGVCDFCTPDWYCDGYVNTTCIVVNGSGSLTQSCNSAADNNTCYSQTGLPSDQYIGTYVEFGSSVLECDAGTSAHATYGQGVLINLLPVIIISGLAIAYVGTRLKSKKELGDSGKIIAGVVLIITVLLLIALL